MKTDISLQTDIFNNLDLFLKTNTQLNQKGLIGGKMGYCINVFSMSKIINNSKLKDIGTGILDEIINEAAEISDLSFTEGLLGIGWGIEYLIKEGFVDANSNEVLFDLDQRVFSRKFYPTSNNDESYLGFMGLGNYMLSRLKSPNATDENLSILMLKQNIIGIIEQLDWGKGIVVLGEQNGLKGALAVLPMMLSFLRDTYDLDIYNSRINKILDWISKNIEYRTIDNLSNKIELVTGLIKIKTLVNNVDKIDYIIGVIKEEISHLYLNFDFLSPDLSDYIKIIKSLTEQSSFASDKQTIMNDITFWMSQFHKRYITLRFKDEHFTCQKFLNEIGFFNGYQGLVSILPVLANFSNPSDILLSDNSFSLKF